jgi:dGTPase
VEAADDIVYSTVDLEDGIKKGSLTWSELLKEFDKKGVKRTPEDVFEKVEQNLKDRLALSGIELTEQEQDEPLSQLFRTMMIWKHMQAASGAFVKNIDSIMKGTFTSELLEEGDTKLIWDASKTIARQRVFPSPSILRLELMGRDVIQDLMNLFWKGIESAPYEEKARGLNHKSYILLSKNYRKVFENAVKRDVADKTNIPVNYRRLQLLADYICGMTDTFAVTLHKELFNG